MNSKFIAPTDPGASLKKKSTGFYFFEYGKNLTFTVENVLTQGRNMGSTNEQSCIIGKTHTADYNCLKHEPGFVKLKGY